MRTSGFPATNQVAMNVPRKEGLKSAGIHKSYRISHIGVAMNVPRKEGLKSLMPIQAKKVQQWGCNECSKKRRIEIFQQIKRYYGDLNKLQ